MSRLCQVSRNNFQNRKIWLNFFHCLQVENWFYQICHPIFKIEGKNLNNYIQNCFFCKFFPLFAQNWLKPFPKKIYSSIYFKKSNGCIQYFLIFYLSIRYFLRNRISSRISLTRLVRKTSIYGSLSKSEKNSNRKSRRPHFSDRTMSYSLREGRAYTDLWKWILFHTS